MALSPAAVSPSPRPTTCKTSSTSTRQAPSGPPSLLSPRGRIDVCICLSTIAGTVGRFEWHSRNLTRMRGVDHPYPFFGTQFAPWLGLVPARISAGLVHFVVLVANGEDGFSSQADVGHSFIQGRQVELADFLVAVVDLRMLGPDRWIPGGLGIDTGHGEILGVNPDGAAIKELGFAQRFHVHQIGRAHV